MKPYSDFSMSDWQTFDKSWTKLCDGGNAEINDHVFAVHPRGATNAGFQLASFRIQSRSAGAARFGIGVRLSRDSWKAGQWTHATTTFSDDTTDFQSVTADDAPLETTTNGDGFLVAGRSPFNYIAINGGIAQAGSPTRVIEYSAGTSTWTTLSVVIQTSTNILGSGTESVFWFQSPTNWVPMTASHGTGVPVGLYGLRIRATTAPSTAAVAATISVSRLHFVHRTVAADGIFEMSFPTSPAILDPHGDALVCATSDPTIGHMVTATYRTRG